MRLFSLTLMGCLIVAGCGRENSVTEISFSQSGVELVKSAHVLDATDWPAWRGPSGDGIALDQALPTAWDESTNILWRSDVPGRGHSSPIVVGDSVVLTTALEQQEQQLVLAVDRVSGQEQWRTVIHHGGFHSKVHEKSTRANGTLACNGEALFTAFLNSRAITATAITLDGDILWQKEVGKFVSVWGYAPSPVLYHSLVIIAADNRGGGCLVALDTETGSIAWRIARGNHSSYSSPAIANVGGLDQLLISGGGAVTSYDPASGEKIWSTPAIAETTCGTIVVSGERIFASGGYPDRETVCLSADGKKLWSNSTKIYEPSMIVVGNQLVGVTDDGIAYGWSVEDGTQIFKKRLGGKFSASPLLCNGQIYAPNLEGTTFVFKVVEEFEMVSKNRLGDDSYASPAAVDGQLFLRIGIGSGRGRREQLVCLAEAAIPQIQKLLNK
jgi:outer membrane protein assembly factor BamB